MHRSSQTIGAIAGALAKAQGELVNPEKTLVATIRSSFPREENKTFRYASLASGLDIVRKCLGRHAIAIMQTTAIDHDHVRLTTLLAHSSGEWVASDLPVCPITTVAAPHRLGTALSYARRYALFALLGIAGEDDLDAPNLESSPNMLSAETLAYRKPSKPGVLTASASAHLRDQMLRELESLADADALAEWTHRRMKDKNLLVDADAKAVEQTGIEILTRVRVSNPARPPHESADTPPNFKLGQAKTIVTPRIKPVRRRNRVHLNLVATEPCLICQRSPCDAHHLKFAQPKALGRKVSDEFTVPLCRLHHDELHRHGDERLWWNDQKIDPLPVAKALWSTSSSRDRSGASTDRANPPAQGLDGL